MAPLSPAVAASRPGQIPTPAYAAAESRWDELIGGQDFTRYGVLPPAAAVVLLPVIIVFLLFQRHFTAGAATTGLK